MIETGLFSYLTTQPDIVALNGERVYPLAKPQNDDQTCIVYRNVGSEYGRNFCGDPDVISSRIQLDCWGVSYSKAKTLAAAVRAAFDFLAGDMGGVDVLSVQWQFESDNLEPDTTFYRVVQDITIYHH